MKKLILIIFVTSFSFISKVSSNEGDLDFFKKFFKNLESTKKIKIDDPVKNESTNLVLYEVFDKSSKSIGFIRDVSTSTGCNDGCLPVIFTLFYSKEGKLLGLRSKEGLTKKYHEPYNDQDYLNLQLILDRNPKSFIGVKHPSEMVDAITRATKKEYVGDVIEKSAYTTLRINLFNQHTLKFLKNYLSNNSQ